MNHRKERTEKNPIQLRKCIQISGVLASPLSVGSGEDTFTDHDVIRRNSLLSPALAGTPFVPGSTLAGVFRHCLQDAFLGSESDECLQLINRLFGHHQTHQSRLMVYDLELTGGIVEKRDGVQLDTFKSAISESKYEMETVRPGAAFTLRLEWLKREQDAVTEDWQLVEELIHRLASGDITLGAKSRRGFGRLKVQQVKVNSFDHTRSEDSLRWLNWLWTEASCDEQWNFDGAGERILADNEENTRLMGRMNKLEVPLGIRQSLMIRRYNEIRFNKGNKNESQKAIPGSVEITDADYEQLKAGQCAVIPGSSWMGAIRARITAIMTELSIPLEEIRERLVSLLGTWTDKETGNKQLIASRIRVEESLIMGGNALLLTRNAIDRFTGGTVKGKLYTSEPWIGGTTKLTLRFDDRNDVPSEVICGLLLWVIEDLQEGLLAVGGETSIGRGTFKSIEEGSIRYNAKPIEAEDRKRFAQAAIEWCLPNQLGGAQCE